jgi:hypothetical protein
MKLFGKSITEPSEADVLELVKQKANEKQVFDQNWIVAVCNQQIGEMEVTIVKLRKLIDLCKNPEVVAGIELFVGKSK